MVTMLNNIQHHHPEDHQAILTHADTRIPSVPGIALPTRNISTISQLKINLLPGFKPNSKTVIMQNVSVMQHLLPLKKQSEACTAEFCLIHSKTDSNIFGLKRLIRTDEHSSFVQMFTEQTFKRNITGTPSANERAKVTTAGLTTVNNQGSTHHVI